MAMEQNQEGCVKCVNVKVADVAVTAMAVAAADADDK